MLTLHWRRRQDLFDVFSASSEDAKPGQQRRIRDSKISARLRPDEFVPNQSSSLRLKAFWRDERRRFRPERRDC
jgi:hypothetical protein